MEFGGIGGRDFVGNWVQEETGDFGHAAPPRGHRVREALSFPLHSRVPAWVLTAGDSRGGKAARSDVV